MARFVVILVGMFIIGVKAQYNYIPPTHPTSRPPLPPPIRILPGDPGCYENAGFYQNPDNCSKFYRCVDQGRFYQRFDFDCAPGTVFDPSISVCNFPGQGGTEQGCNSARYPPAPPFRPEPERRPVVVTVEIAPSAGSDFPDEERVHIFPPPNSGNYGQRESNTGNRRPNQRPNQRRPNPNNVRIWSTRNTYDYE